MKKVSATCAFNRNEGKKTVINEQTLRVQILIS